MKNYATTTGLMAAILFLTTFTASAQTDDAATFMEKQFYGNRIQGGSVILNGSLRHTGFGDDDLDGVTTNLGLGLGIGLGENVVLNAGYQRNKAGDIFANIDGQIIERNLTVNTYQVGFRYLPNTVGGFVQPYFGVDYLFEKWKTRSGDNDDVLSEESYMGARIPVGVIFWVSTFMAVSVEPISLRLMGQTGDDVEEYNSVFNAELSMLNPTFGISFLLNGKKP